ncbi:MAG TPA: 3-hydroxyacyl-CoA dehydrogenase NAD-binding domain-containing protein [Steroidobacteraceae bacterium]|nr:3-hydroxyacyl-CoA dehydrogenase NAD-binding domain-containing protein [Steroidobacteraceae bacterium]
MSVVFEIHDGIAVARIERPPVNAIDASIRAGLLWAVTRTVESPDVHALLVYCAGRTFMSGADLAELGGVVPPPGYAETLAALENCPKPVIASLHGTALGGGLEVAMACHYRCATSSARMGMPEITLGIIPGAGGTQRLPRLVGPLEALGMLLSGAPIDASRARDIGLIDEVVGDDAFAGGLDYARRLVRDGAGVRPTRAMRERLQPPGEQAIAGLLEKHARALKGRTTQHSVIRAVEAASQSGFEDGLRLEAQLSAESLKTAESRALRHVFFAERECGRIPGLAGSAPAAAVRKGAVIGAGTMGTGIAMSLADAGIPVVLVERDAQALERGLALIRSNYQGSVQRGRLDAAAAEKRIAAIQGTLEFAAARDADLAIEAVFEDMDLKRTILTRLDQVLPAHAVLASNTSSLSLTELAAATGNPERVVGLHFFSPANVMRLLEIVRGAHTSGATLLAALALAKTLRKVGVVVGDGFGFVGNRMMLDGYFREAELMLLQGVPPSRIDAVMENFGFAMGPNRVNDMAGIDVGTRVRIELLRREARPAPYHVVSDALTARGHLGQKTGQGIYRYVKGDRSAHDNPELGPLVAELAAQHGVPARPVSDLEIEQRCVLSLVNIGAAILADGLAYRASDIDVIWTSGYGFPRWRGGPMCYADSLGLARVVEQMRALAETGGGAYWAISPLLLELARDGRTFADLDRSRRE